MRRAARAIGWIGALGLAVAGLWLAGAVLTDRAIEAGFDQLRHDGWQVAAEAQGTGGGPSHLDTALTGLSIAAPAQLRLDVPRLELTHQLTPPGQFTLTAPQGPVPALHLSDPTSQHSADALRLEARLSPLPPFALRELALALSGLRSHFVLWPQGAVSLDGAQVTLTETGPARYGFAATLIDTRLTAPGLQALPEITRIALSGHLVLAAPLSARPDPPQLSAIEAATLELVWGEARLTGSGAVSVTAEGVLEGRMDLTLTEHQTFLEQLAAAGMITDAAARQFEIQAALLGSLTEDGGPLEAPLVLSGGRMFLGPFPLGPAPRF